MPGSEIKYLLDRDKFNCGFAQARLINLKSKALNIQISNYGARVVSIFCKDRDGNYSDVILGCDEVTDYFTGQTIYMGATIGRYANRISKSSFSIEGDSYLLNRNEGSHHLHGGVSGFHAVWWDVVEYSDTSCTLSYFSKNGEQGYPGNLKVQVRFSLEDDDQFKIEYKATTDLTTPVNITNHSYFNLTGNADKKIIDHKIRIDASSYIPVDKEYIPTGDIADVRLTSFDFTCLSKIGDQLKCSNEIDGYDHSWLFESNDIKRNTIRVEDDQSGRFLELTTDKPAVHFYTSELNCRGKNNASYKDFSAFCLETQYLPNSPNQPNFPFAFLKTDEEYNFTTVFRFGLI